jgi:hypothetical protein
VLTFVRAGGPGLGFKLLLELEIEQRGQRGICLEQHVAPFAAVSAGRSALGDVRLPSPRDRAVASVSGTYTDSHSVDETHNVKNLACRHQNGREVVPFPRRAERRRLLGRGRLSEGLDAHEGASLSSTLAELYSAVDEREQGEVASGADVRSSLHMAANLAYEDVSGLHDLTTEALNAAKLRV